MIKESNTRVIITMSKKQAKWLKKTAKSVKMSVSKLCKWLMEKNIAKIAQYWEEEDINTLIKIAKTPWIVNLDEDSNEKFIGQAEYNKLQNKNEKFLEAFFGKDDEEE